VPPAHNLLAAPFDAKRLEFTGAPVIVVEGVEITAARSMLFDLARNGSLIYVPDTTGSLEDKVVWVDRKGGLAPVMDTVAEWVQPRLSPDGERLLLRKVETNCDLWIYDLQRRVLTRLTFENDNHHPLWMPDGKRVVFDIPNGSVRGLVWQAADGSGKVQTLIQGVRDFMPSSWSGDGRFLALTLFGQSASQIWVLAQEGPPEPHPFHQNAFNEAWPSFSPDGRYLAYSSDQSGRSEIYISPFPGPGAVTQVSAEGGADPLWSRDGRELFYENGTNMMAVKVATQPSLSIGVAQELFQGDFGSGFRRSFFGREYDVTPDGKRFVMLEPVGQTASLPQIHVIVHFSEELRRLVSAGGKQ
jgi:eukaryotic-like serine/threonine-protein kinase